VNTVTVSFTAIMGQLATFLQSDSVQTGSTFRCCYCV